MIHMVDFLKTCVVWKPLFLFCFHCTSLSLCGTLYQRMWHNHVGSDDGTVRLWEVQSGRCWKVWDMGGKVCKVQWNPNPTISILAVAVYALPILIHILS